MIKDEPISESPYFTASPSLSQDRSVTQTEALGLQNIAISVASQNGANNSGKGEKNKTTGTVNSTRGPSEKALATLPKTVKIFQTIVNVEHSLGEFRKLFLPSFVKVLDDTEIVLETRRITLCYLMHLANDTELHQFVPRIIQPLLRLLSCKKESTIQAAAITAFSCLVCRLGANYAPYVIPVRRRMKAMAQREGSSWCHQIDEYETLVARLLRQRSLPSEPASAPDIAIRYARPASYFISNSLFLFLWSIRFTSNSAFSWCNETVYLVRYDDRMRIRAVSAKIPMESSLAISVQSLETAWALSDRNNVSGTCARWCGVRWCAEV